jgi:hypothetical protein
MLAACAGAPAPSQSAVPKDAAVIVNSGSTNTRPYRIVVRPNRSAVVMTTGQAERKATLSAKTSDAFFKDLAAAMPLSKIAHQPCMKSASFGSSTYVEYKGERSPDISCGAEGAGAKLAEDVRRIADELKVVTFGRFVRPLAVPQSAPSPEPSPENKPTY